MGLGILVLGHDSCVNICSKSKFGSKHSKLFSPQMRVIFKTTCKNQGYVHLNNKC